MVPTTGATGAWINIADKFTQWTGTTWASVVAPAGTIIAVENEDKYYRMERNPSQWVEFCFGLHIGNSNQPLPDYAKEWFQPDTGYVGYRLEDNLWVSPLGGGGATTGGGGGGGGAGGVLI